MARTTNSNKKGYTANILSLIQEKQQATECCLDFLTEVVTEDSASVTFTGSGTKSDPLSATALGGGTITGANDGLSIIGTDIQFGQIIGATDDPAKLTENREVPLNGFSINFIDPTGNPDSFIQAPSLSLNHWGNAPDGSSSIISMYGANLEIFPNNYGEGILVFPFVSADANFFGITGVQSWPYVTGSTIGIGHAKFPPYIAAFSAAILWDGSGGSGGNILPLHMNYFSALQTQSGGVINGHDFYASEYNSVNGTTQNPPVTNHYAFYAEPFIYATNNFGVYINGLQTNYFGGNVGIGTKTPTAALHIEGTRVTPRILDNSTTSGAKVLIGVDGFPSAADQAYGSVYLGSAGGASATDVGVELRASSKSAWSASNFGSYLDILIASASSTGRPVTLSIGKGSSSVLIPASGVSGQVPLTIQSNGLVATPIDGSIEYSGTHFFATIGTTRFQLDQQTAANLTATASITFGVTAAQSSSEQTITVTGAVVGDPVAVSVPPLGASLGTCITAYVSAANTVTVRFNNYGTIPLTPTAQSYKVIVFK